MEDLVVPATHSVKLKESENRDKDPYIAWELKKKKTMRHESNGHTNYNWCAR